MSDERADFRRNYLPAFLRYLSQREESALRSGYELGRAAAAAGLSLLDIAETHHGVLFQVIGSTRPDELGDLAEAAAAFLADVLSPYEMTHRAYAENYRESRPSA